MVACLPNPCSTKLQANNNINPFSMLIGRTGKHLSYIPIISTLKTSYETKNHPVLQESSSRRPTQLFVDQTLTTSGFSSKLKTKQKEDETLENEVENVICRLKEVVERVREIEIQKIMGRFKGTTMSDEDILLVENSSREIVDKFLQRPVQYLKSVNGDLQEKLKDLNLLIRMLEKSCLECQR